MNRADKTAVAALSHKLGGANESRASTYQSLRDVAYEAIKHRIITCQFRPGECLNEAYVSGILGIGRTPVHQAFDRLMSEDMVEVIPRKGIVVKPVVLDDLMQMIDVRVLNESYSARLAAERADDKLIAKIDQVLVRARKSVSSRDVQKMMLLDSDFHLLLAGASRNDELVGIVRKLNERSLRFWFTSLGDADHHVAFQEQHEAILAEVRDRNPSGAEDAMRTHIESFRKSVIRRL